MTVDVVIVYSSINIYVSWREKKINRILLYNYRFNQNDKRRLQIHTIRGITEGDAYKLEVALVTSFIAAALP